MLLSDTAVSNILKENNLKKDIYKLIRHSDVIQELAIKKGNVLNRTSIISILHNLKEHHNIPERTSISHFLRYTIEILNMFEEVKILDERNDKLITRYVANYIDVSPYEVALSLLSNSFLSHYSALYLHDLTLNIPKDIYINREQSIKPVNKENAQLTQGRVDYAFSKPMRSTNTVYSFKLRGQRYKVHVLNSKNTKNTGIIKKQAIGFSTKVKVTDINRTLIDVTVRPAYSGGASEVLNAYHRAKDTLNTKVMYDYLLKFNYIYPYEKAILFYLKLNKANKMELEPFRKMLSEDKNKKINFYLDYQIVGKKLDENIGIWYPAELDNYFNE